MSELAINEKDGPQSQLEPSSDNVAIRIVPQDRRFVNLPQLITPEEACKVLGCSLKQLTRMVKFRTVPFYRITPRIIRFDYKVLAQ